MERTRQDWRPERIQYELAKRGLSYAELDRRNGIPDSCCRSAARKPDAKGEAAIAEALGKSPEVIWPSRYQPDGTRHQPQPAANYNPPRRFSSAKTKKEA